MSPKCSLVAGQAGGRSQTGHASGVTRRTLLGTAVVVVAVEAGAERTQTGQMALFCGIAGDTGCSIGAGHARVMAGNAGFSLTVIPEALRAGTGGGGSTVGPTRGTVAWRSSAGGTLVAAGGTDIHPVVVVLGVAVAPAA